MTVENWHVIANILVSIVYLIGIIYKTSIIEKKYKKQNESRTTFYSFLIIPRIFIYSLKNEELNRIEEARTEFLSSFLFFSFLLVILYYLISQIR